ncbi:MAG TPA: hypothetical protein VGJ56_11195 [Reyranella sp.]|jgi:hypothetical protein
MRMLCTATVVGLVALSGGIHAQTAAYVDYCKSLQATYRQAVANGKPASAAAGEEGASCPTNPNGSIPVFEKVLKNMNAELPKRP